MTTDADPTPLRPASSSIDESRGSVLRRVISTLLDVPGVVACHRLTGEELQKLIDIEARTNHTLYLAGLEIVNEGIKEVSRRECFIVIAHNSELRHPPGAILIICSGNDVVGEEVWDPNSIAETSQSSNVIFLGRGLKLFRDSLERTKGKPLKVCYKALEFPELGSVKGVSDVVSVTVNPLTHTDIARFAGWDDHDPNLGTVLIGFNVSVS